MASEGREGEGKGKLPEFVLADRKGLADATAGREEVGAGTNTSEEDRNGLPVAAPGPAAGSGWKGSA